MRGFKFTVGEQDVALYEVGRMKHVGNADSHVIYLLDGEDGKQLMSYGINMRPKFPGDMVWTRTGKSLNYLARKAYNFPIILQAGKSYYLVSSEDERFTYAPETEITPPTGVRIDGSVAITANSPNAWTHKYVSADVGSVANRTFGPVNMKIASVPVSAQSANETIELGYLQESRNGIENRSQSLSEKYISRQALFLAGESSSATLETTIAEPGIYALIFSMAHKRDQTPWIKKDRTGATDNPIDIYVTIDGTEHKITPSGQQDVRPNRRPWLGEGFWIKTRMGFDFMGSAPFTTTEPNQKITIRFAGSAKGTHRVVQVDDIALASSTIMTAGQIPSGGGFAEGAPDVSNWEARIMSMYRYVQAFGMKAISYEGGWYPGGDANKMPLQYQSSFL